MWQQYRNIQSVIDKSDFSEELKNSLMMVEWPKHVGVFLRNFKLILINDIEVVHVLVLTIEWPY